MKKLDCFLNPKRIRIDMGYIPKKDIEIIRCILIVKNFGFLLREISILIHDEILCGNIQDIKRIVGSKINELSVKIKELKETKKLLEKVKGTLLSKNIECCNDIEIYLKK